MPVGPFFVYLNYLNYLNLKTGDPSPHGPMNLRKLIEEDFRNLHRG